MTKANIVPKKATKDADKPWIRNYPPLREWIDKHEGRCNWQIPLGDPDCPNAYVESWSFPGSTQEAIVIVLANQNGWNVYTPCSDNRIDETVADAEQRIGLVPR